MMYTCPNGNEDAARERVQTKIHVSDRESISDVCRAYL